MNRDVHPPKKYIGKILYKHTKMKKRRRRSAEKNESVENPVDRCGNFGVCLCGTEEKIDELNECKNFNFSLFLKKKSVIQIASRKNNES